MGWVTIAVYDGGWGPGSGILPILLLSVLPEALKRTPRQCRGI